jgi:peptide/nickel transport system ATP-binding protein
MREIDIPDPINPPSGCRFHTRCPVAREACKAETPGSYPVDSESEHEAACYRVLDDHDYWESQPLEDGEDEQVQQRQRSD